MPTPNRRVMPRGSHRVQAYVTRVIAVVHPKLYLGKCFVHYTHLLSSRVRFANRGLKFVNFTERLGSGSLEVLAQTVVVLGFNRVLGHDE